MEKKIRELSKIPCPNVSDNPKDGAGVILLSPTRHILGWESALDLVYWRHISFLLDYMMVG